MEDRFLQQLKKGVLEMLVLETVCAGPTYGYELLALKEGTLYPILYRLEDDGFVTASWSAGEGRSAPKKIYTATASGREEIRRRRVVWGELVRTVDSFTETAQM